MTLVQTLEFDSSEELAWCLDTTKDRFQVNLLGVQPKTDPQRYYLRQILLFFKYYLRPIYRCAASVCSHLSKLSIQYGLMNCVPLMFILM